MDDLVGQGEGKGTPSLMEDEGEPARFIDTAEAAATTLTPGGTATTSSASSVDPRDPVTPSMTDAYYFYHHTPQQPPRTSIADLPPKLVDEVDLLESPSEGAASPAATASLAFFHYLVKHHPALLAHVKTIPLELLREDILGAQHAAILQRAEQDYRLDPLNSRLLDLPTQGGLERFLSAAQAGLLRPDRANVPTSTPQDQTPPQPRRISTGWPWRDGMCLDRDGHLCDSRPEGWPEDLPQRQAYHLPGFTIMKGIHMISDFCQTIIVQTPACRDIASKFFFVLHRPFFERGGNMLFLTTYDEIAHGCFVSLIAFRQWVLENTPGWFGFLLQDNPPHGASAHEKLVIGLDEKHQQLMRVYLTGNWSDSGWGAQASFAQTDDEWFKLAISNEGFEPHWFARFPDKSGPGDNILAHLGHSLEEQFAKGLLHFPMPFLLAPFERIVDPRALNALKTWKYFRGGLLQMEEDATFFENSRSALRHSASAPAQVSRLPTIPEAPDDEGAGAADASASSSRPTQPSGTAAGSSQKQRAKPLPKKRVKRPRLPLQASISTLLPLTGSFEPATSTSPASDSPAAPLAQATSAQSSSNLQRFPALALDSTHGAMYKTYENAQKELKGLTKKKDGSREFFELELEIAEKMRKAQEEALENVGLSPDPLINVAKNSSNRSKPSRRSAPPRPGTKALQKAVKQSQVALGVNEQEPDAAPAKRRKTIARNSDSWRKVKDGDTTALCSVELVDGSMCNMPLQDWDGYVKHFALAHASSGIERPEPTFTSSAHSLPSLGAADTTRDVLARAASVESSTCVESALDKSSCVDFSFVTFALFSQALNDLSATSSPSSIGTRAESSTNPADASFANPSHAPGIVPSLTLSDSMLVGTSTEGSAAQASISTAPVNHAGDAVQGGSIVGAQTMICPVILKDGSTCGKTCKGEMGFFMHFGRSHKSLNIPRPDPVSSMLPGLPARPTPSGTLDCSVSGCDLSFTSAENLRIHLEVHAGLRPFVCLEPGCGLGYRKRDHLNNHQISHVVDPDRNRPFLCRKCSSQRFSRKSSLTRHESTCDGKPRSQRKRRTGSRGAGQLDRPSDNTATISAFEGNAGPPSVPVATSDGTSGIVGAAGLAATLAGAPGGPVGGLDTPNQLDEDYYFNFGVRSEHSASFGDAVDGAGQGSPFASGSGAYFTSSGLNTRFASPRLDNGAPTIAAESPFSPATPVFGESMGLPTSTFLSNDSAATADYSLQPHHYASSPFHDLGGMDEPFFLSDYATDLGDVCESRSAELPESRSAEHPDDSDWQSTRPTLATPLDSTLSFVTPVNPTLIAAAETAQQNGWSKQEADDFVRIFMRDLLRVCRDERGNRIVQSLLKDASPEVQRELRDELLKLIRVLSIDRYGSYVAQKLIVDAQKAKPMPIDLHAYLAEQFKDTIGLLMMHEFGNYVAFKLLALRSQPASALHSTVLSSLSAIAHDDTGLRSVRTWLRSLHQEDPLRAQLCDAIVSQAPNLANSPSGNRLLIVLLDLEFDRYGPRLADDVRSRPWAYNSEPALRFLHRIRRL